MKKKNGLLLIGITLAGIVSMSYAATCSKCKQGFHEQCESLPDWKVVGTMHEQYCCDGSYRIRNHMEQLGSWTYYDSNEHRKACNGEGCNLYLKEAHIDAAPVDSFCDVCGGEMYEMPSAIIGGPSKVNEGQEAIFVLNVTSGNDVQFQWYYDTPSSKSNLMVGETSSVLKFVVDKDMTGNSYYCKLSNRKGTVFTKKITITVYIPFTLKPLSDMSLGKGETKELAAEIEKPGFPDTYTYQWYVASSLEGEGTKINRATSNRYIVRPTRNTSEEYYYCIVDNGRFQISTTRAKLVADLVPPEIKLLEVVGDLEIANKESSILLRFEVTDNGEGYVEDGNNFTENSITLKVGNHSILNAQKVVRDLGITETGHQYEVELTNMTGNGKLTVIIPAGAIKDKVGNGNTRAEFPTNITMSNGYPDILVESITGANENGYMNKQNTLKLKVVLIDETAFNPNDFTADDLQVKVNDTVIDTANKLVKFLEKVENQSYYEVTLSNIEGNGKLSLFVPANSVTDENGSSNADTELTLSTTAGKQVMVDNVTPTMIKITTKMGSATGNEYPTALDAKYNGWSKEDIYVQLEVDNPEDIAYYSKSYDGVNFETLGSYQDVLKESMNRTVTYRAYDSAGNYAEKTVAIKLDKTLPIKPKINMTEIRQDGTRYVYSAENGTSKSIFVIPDAATLVDSGDVQSGIYGDEAYTYYTIKAYEDQTKANPITELTRKCDIHTGMLLNQNGYYEIQAYICDIAGNEVASDLYQVYIDKRAENTIRITNINDVGSGVSKVTIQIYKSDSAGNEINEQARNPIVIENPNTEIIQNVKLGGGTFYVRVTLEDKVGNQTKLMQKITNVL